MILEQPRFPPYPLLAGMSAPALAMPGLTGLPGLAGLQAAGLLGGVAPPSQQATRHARRVYVGGLPPTATEPGITTFFSNALSAIGGMTAGPGMPRDGWPVTVHARFANCRAQGGAAGVHRT